MDFPYCVIVGEWKYYEGTKDRGSDHKTIRNSRPVFYNKNGNRFLPIQLIKRPPLYTSKYLYPEIDNGDKPHLIVGMKSLRAFLYSHN